MVRYGVLDLVFAGLYGYVGFVLAPSRASWFQITLGVVLALLVLSGVNLILQTRFARSIGILAATVLLLFSAAVVLGLCASAAYLRGIYGAIGQGLAVITLVAIALVIEFFALLPLFQLHALLRSTGSR